MNYILFDDTHREELYPFTLSRPVCEIRAGILTLKEKWDTILNSNCAYHTVPHLSVKYDGTATNWEGKEATYINGAVYANSALAKEINELLPNTALTFENRIIAIKVANYSAAINPNTHNFKSVASNLSIKLLCKPWELFTENGVHIAADFSLITANRKSEAINNTNTVIAPENIFIEKGAVVNCSILNASTGPIYIGKDAEVMEGCMIRGPFSLGNHSALKMGAKIYGPTTIGPECKVGGEINNSVLFGYSNKAHDGFLGNSVIGEWCNLGADTNNSNLKNNYGVVKVWDMAHNDWQNTNLQFCGLLMGDHSKAGINTMFNTGTVAGFCANVFDGGFPPKFIPSYSWGGRTDSEKFELNKAIEVAKKVYERRGLDFTEADEQIFNYLFNKG